MQIQNQKENKQRESIKETIHITPIYLLIINKLHTHYKDCIIFAYCCFWLSTAVWTKLLRRAHHSTPVVAKSECIFVIHIRAGSNKTQAALCCLQHYIHLYHVYHTWESLKFSIVWINIENSTFSTLKTAL